MEKVKDCIFCKIVSGEMPSHKIWEDDRHLAFLSIFPNLKGSNNLKTKSPTSFKSRIFAANNFFTISRNYGHVTTSLIPHASNINSLQ